MKNDFFRREYDSYCALMRKVPSLALTILVLSVVSMNLLANKELLKTSWIALDCGFALSWLPFLIMDCMCKVYGGKDATRLSILALVINLIFFGIFKLIALTPGMWGEYYATGLHEVNDSLNRTIGGSSWIVFGSALAMFVASIVNSIVNVSVAKLLRNDNYKSFAVRSFSSTLVSQFVDNLVFALVVSIPLFGWNMKQALVCAITAALLELMMEVCFSGIGYKLSKKMTKPET
ncbi:MAG: VUT family protein [Prevotellaceae bacterium]|nr:VUT family protein [Prevotellaceae bacterium]